MQNSTITTLLLVQGVVRMEGVEKRKKGANKSPFLLMHVPAGEEQRRYISPLLLPRNLKDLTTFSQKVPGAARPWKSNERQRD